jgi:cation diffusion facilitator family transporter
MSSTCCTDNKFDGTSLRYKRVLWIVIALNAGMFLVESIGGIFSQSQALQADALDFLADSLTYGLSLWVIGRSIKLRSLVALIKGLSLSLMGTWVLMSTVYRMFSEHAPEPVTMGWIAGVALLVNLLSVVLLFVYKEGDANIRSVWLCSRNDAVGNIAVMLAASAVWFTQSGWPDLIVALLMASLFFSSSLQIIRQSLNERRSYFAKGRDS